MLSCDHLNFPLSCLQQNIPLLQIKYIKVYKQNVFSECYREISHSALAETVRILFVLFCENLYSVAADSTFFVLLPRHQRGVS